MQRADVQVVLQSLHGEERGKEDGQISAKDDRGREENKKEEEKESLLEAGDGDGKEEEAVEEKIAGLEDDEV